MTSLFFNYILNANMYFSFCFLLWKADPDPDPDGIGCWCSLLRCRSVIPPQWYLTDCTHSMRAVFHTILTNIDVCTFEINFLDLGLLCVLFASMAQSLWGVPPTVKPTVKLVSVGNEQKLVMYLLSLGGNKFQLMEPSTTTVDDLFRIGTKNGDIH